MNTTTLSRPACEPEAARPNDRAAWEAVAAAHRAIEASRDVSDDANDAAGEVRRAMISFPAPDIQAVLEKIEHEALAEYGTPGGNPEPVLLEMARSDAQAATLAAIHRDLKRFTRAPRAQAHCYVRDLLDEADALVPGREQEEAAQLYEGPASTRLEEIRDTVDQMQATSVEGVCFQLAVAIAVQDLVEDQLKDFDAETLLEHKRLARLLQSALLALQGAKPLRPALEAFASPYTFVELNTGPAEAFNPSDWLAQYRAAGGSISFVHGRHGRGVCTGFSFGTDEQRAEASRLLNIRGPSGWKFRAVSEVAEAERAAILSTKDGEAGFIAALRDTDFTPDTVPGKNPEGAA